jgi:hypothetical protein
MEIVLHRDEEGGFSSAETRDKLTARATESFATLGVALGDAGKQFWSALSDSGVRLPSEVELSLSVALEVGGQWLVVSGKSSASVAVKLKWSGAPSSGSAAK